MRLGDGCHTGKVGGQHSFTHVTFKLPSEQTPDSSGLSDASYRHLL